LCLARDIPLDVASLTAVQDAIEAFLAGEARGLPLLRRMAGIRDYRRLVGGWNRTELAVVRE
jgi:hypothetical protein